LQSSCLRLTSPLSKVSFSPNYEKSSKEEFFVFENHLWHHHHLVIVSTAFWPKKIHNDAYSTFYKTLCLCETRRFLSWKWFDWLNQKFPEIISRTIKW
jgi:hypothetical protein